MLCALSIRRRILGTLTSPQETLEHSQPALGPLEPMPSTQYPVCTFFSTELFGLSLCAHDDFIPTPSNEECLRHSPFHKKSPRLFSSTQRILKYAPFHEGDIRFSLSELEALKSISAAESSLTSSKCVKKNSITTSDSEKGAYGSSQSYEDDLRSSPPPQVIHR